MSHPAHDIIRDGVLDYAIEKGLTIDEAAKLYEETVLQAAEDDGALTFKDDDDYSDLD